MVHFQGIVLIYNYSFNKYLLAGAAEVTELVQVGAAVWLVIEQAAMVAQPNKFWLGRERLVCHLTLGLCRKKEKIINAAVFRNYKKKNKN